MSERIYTCLLHLYPPRFRKEYKQEMLQLYRDRLRDEPGFLRRLRLGFDLLADVIVGLPRAYRTSAAPAGVSLAPMADGIPSFRAIENEPLRPESILIGSTLAFGFIVLFAFLMTWPAVYRPLSRARVPKSSIESVLQKLNQPAIPDSDEHTDQGALQTASGSGSTLPSAQVATAATTAPSSAVLPVSANQGKSIATNIAAGPKPVAPLRARWEEPTYASNLFPAVPIRTVSTSVAQNSSPQSGANPVEARTTKAVATKPSSETGDTAIDPSERRRVIDAVIANMKEHYFDRNLAQKTADALQAHQSNGDDAAATDGAALAALLTRQLRDASHDMHLVVDYSPDKLPSSPAAPTAGDLARYRSAMRQQNCTFEKIETLPRNIGYLKLNSFPDPDVCDAVAHAAMKRLNKASAVIFDLRDNRGGQPEMVAEIASTLFDRQVSWYNPRHSPSAVWLSPKRGSSLAHKPVYILTSSRTFSGAEHFTYNLKMLKRAVVVGETTGGAAHAGVFHRLDDHFGMGIPETPITNPYGGPDWSGTGVEPDVKVDTADALAAAEKLARSRRTK